MPGRRSRDDGRSSLGPHAPAGRNGTPRGARRHPARALGRFDGSLGTTQARPQRAVSLTSTTAGAAASTALGSRHQAAIWSSFRRETMSREQTVLLLWRPYSPSPRPTPAIHIDAR